jgi:hypothetical protein
MATEMIRMALRMEEKVVVALEHSRPEVMTLHLIELGLIRESKANPSRGPDIAKQMLTIHGAQWVSLAWMALVAAVVVVLPMVTAAIANHLTFAPLMTTVKELSVEMVVTERSSFDTQRPSMLLR